MKGVWHDDGTSLVYTQQGKCLSASIASVFTTCDETNRTTNLDQQHLKEAPNAHRSAEWKATAGTEQPHEQRNKPLGTAT